MSHDEIDYTAIKGNGLRCDLIVLNIWLEEHKLLGQIQSNSKPNVVKSVFYLLNQTT